MTAPLIDLPDDPQPLPLDLARRLNGMRKDRRRRLLQGLYLLAHTGYPLAVELRACLAANLFIRPQNGGLQRLFQVDLPESGLVVSQKLPFIRGSRLTLLRLTEAGEDVCRQLGWETAENEWQRLIDDHRGEDLPLHTAGLLAFCFQVRRRGWEVELLPQASESVEPDVAVRKGDPGWLYVEFETEPRGKFEKWRKAYEFQGLVAVAALTPGRCRRLVEECRQSAASGVATDLQTLSSGNAASSLWQTSWRNRYDDGSRLNGWIG